MKAEPSTAGPSPPATSVPRKHLVRNLAIVVVAIVIVVVALALIPVPRSFSEELNSSFADDGIATLSLSSACSVKGSWSTSDGDSVTLSIVDSNDVTIYSSHASGGSFNVAASSPPYTFSDSSDFSETVHISGTESCPLI
jgi:hypothetical protein